MTHWKIGLNNGENFTEGVEPFDIVTGKKTPWLRLQEYIKEKKLKITSLCLIYQDRTFNLPSGGNNPKFRAFNKTDKPADFNFFRMLGFNVNEKNKDFYAIIEALYPSKEVEIPGDIEIKDGDEIVKTIPKIIKTKISGYKLQLWVDENNPNNCWVLVK